MDGLFLQILSEHLASGAVVPVSTLTRRLQLLEASMFQLNEGSRKMSPICSVSFQINLHPSQTVDDFSVLMCFDHC